MLLIIILFVNGVSFVYSQQEISKERKENRFLEIEVDNPELQKGINAHYINVRV